MNLQELLNYNHKTKKITFHNNNTYSLVPEVVIKITLPDVTDNDCICFTYNNELLPHQSIDNDFYIRIPNIVNQNTDIYAHYFASDLYEYEELEEVFSIYDFQELYDFLQTNQKKGNVIKRLQYCYTCGYATTEIQNTPVCPNCNSTQLYIYNEDYAIEVNYDEDQTYDYSIDESGRLTIQSKLTDSVTKYKDPNYKNYLSNDINKTEKGRFPLSSHFRPNTNTKAPKIKNENNPKWPTTDNSPFWEVRINRKGLSPLISNGIEDSEGNIIKDIPLNVLLDYEYVPTSTEYHQHYYGIEGQETEPNSINIFEGTNLNDISDKFNTNNYKLINWNNPYDNSSTMYVQHGQTIPIDFADFTPAIFNDVATCKWEKNKCHNYWIYTTLTNPANNQGYCYTTIHNLKDNAWYSLKCYVYLPSFLPTNISKLFDIEIISNYLSDNPIIYKIDDAFLQQDTKNKDQWIYHEIPFEATETVLIKIYGPNVLENGIIFFTDMLLEKMPRFSPTIKYNSRGVYVIDADDNTEDSKYTYKSTHTLNSTETDNTPTKQWTKKEKELPTPFSEVFISSNNNLNLYYDQTSTKIYYEYSGKNVPTLKYENGIIISEYDQNDFFIPCDSNENQDKILKIKYDNFLIVTKGPNNKFKIHFTDTTGKNINEGSATASICTMNKQQAKYEDNTPVLSLPKKNVINGYITWDNIDFTNLAENDDENNLYYYLKVEYNNECFYKGKTEYIRFIIVEEELEIQANIIDNLNNTTSDLTTTYIVSDSEQFPLQINAEIQNQNEDIITNGYCELSIDDKVDQTSFVDLNGQCDFYIDLDNITCGTHTIKIEYYREYNKALCFYYFEINVQDCDARPRVPIEFKVFEQGRIRNIDNTNLFECDYNDCILFNINTGQHSEFQLQVWKDAVRNNENEIISEPIIRENITSVNKLDYIYLDADQMEIAINNDIEHDYTVKTGNMKDSQGNEINNKYRDYERTLHVIKKTEVDRYSN